MNTALGSFRGRIGCGLFRFSGDAADVYDRHHRFFHALDGEELVGTVEVEAAGEDVGAGESAEGELGAVGAAADGADSGGRAGLGDGLAGDVDDVHLGLDHLAHVVVLVFEGEGGGAWAVVLVDGIDDVGDLGFATLEVFAVVVADDEGELGLLDGAADVGEVEESLVAFGGFGGLVGRELGDDFGGDACGVDHLAFGVAGVDGAAVDGDACGGGVEVLEFDFADLAAVHGVGEVASESVNVEVVGAESDFFVGVEGDADFAVLDVGVLLQIDHGLDDFGDAGFVVGSEQGGAVGDDEVFADVPTEFGKLLDGGDDAFGEGDVAAVIVWDDARLDVLARCVGAGVHVGDEADGGHRTVGVGGQGGVEIAEGVESYILEPFADELFAEVLGEDALLLGGWGLVGVFRRLCVEGDVTEETFNDSHVFGWFLMFFSLSACEFKEKSWDVCVLSVNNC